MSAAYTKGGIIVCGLHAHNMTIRTNVERISVGTFMDPLDTIDMPATFNVLFDFYLRNSDELAIAQERFPVGSHSPFHGHDLGPGDVCRYCGTAWLPGTLQCPACGGETDHAEKAIEYATKQAGIITSTELEMRYTEAYRFHVEAEFSHLVWTGDLYTMFRHSLWRTDPALWVCRFCGHMVYGETADCPGCGGKRQAIKDLATQYRECLWCGTQTYGGYSCTTCNMRLKAKEQHA